jgi:hypothetical protein
MFLMVRPEGARPGYADMRADAVDMCVWNLAQGW